MKRLHIHLAVNELPESIEFYSTFFNAEPSVEHEDYAKWVLNEPAVNFAISNRGHESGLNHLGMQVDSEDELEEIAKRLDSAEIAASKQASSSCCYAHSNKHWALDPQGIPWESFQTLNDIPTFGGNADVKLDSAAGSKTESSACCIPKEENATGCCS